MVDTPIIFVTYPIGAGGWFLASLLSSTYTTSETPIKYDSVGSGHANQEITYLNNWYTLVMDPVIQDILYQKNINDMLKEQRIDYLRKNLHSSANYNNINTHVISLHCQDLNIFLKAFPNSKAIIIDVANNDIEKCMFNFIYKVLASNLEYFQMICNRHNKNFSDYVRLLQSIDSLALQQLNWLSSDVEVTIPCTPIEHDLASRIIRIGYQDYIDIADPQQLILKFNSFLQTSWKSDVIDKLTDNLVLYRLRQPTFPVY